MKRNLLICLSFSLAMFSCSKSTTEEFEEVNPGTSEKYIEEVTIIGSSIAEYNQTISLSYDSENRVSTIFNGTDLALTVFENGELQTISSNNTDPFNFNELYQAPYDIYEDGHVVSYDGNGNPEEVDFFELEAGYIYQNGSYVYVETEKTYTAEITYDSKPNPYYHTLKAAGLIDVLDKVQLNLSMNATASDIKKAREFFPLNNVKEILYKDETETPIAFLKVDYVYDEDNYPTQATVSWTNLKHEESEVILLKYSYLNE